MQCYKISASFRDISLLHVYRPAMERSYQYSSALSTLLLALAHAAMSTMVVCLVAWRPKVLSRLSSRNARSTWDVASARITELRVRSCMLPCLRASTLISASASSTLHHHRLARGGLVPRMREVGYADRILGVSLCVCIVKVDLA